MRRLAQLFVRRGLITRVPMTNEPACDNAAPPNGPNAATDTRATGANTEYGIIYGTTALVRVERKGNSPKTPLACLI